MLQVGSQNTAYGGSFFDSYWSGTFGENRYPRSPLILQWDKATHFILHAFGAAEQPSKFFPTHLITIAPKCAKHRPADHLAGTPCERWTGSGDRGPVTSNAEIEGVGTTPIAKDLKYHIFPGEELVHRIKSQCHVLAFLVQSSDLHARGQEHHGGKCDLDHQFCC